MSTPSLARVLVTLTLSAVAFIAGACGSSHETIRLSHADSGSAVTVASGDTIRRRGASPLIVWRTGTMKPARRRLEDLKANQRGRLA